MGCGASRVEPVVNTLSEKDRTWISARITSASRSRVKSPGPITQPPASVTIGIQTEHTNKKIQCTASQTDQVGNRAQCKEIAIQTDDPWNEDLSGEEDEDQEGLEAGNDLDVNAKDILKNMLLMNVETYGEEDTADDVLESTVKIIDDEDEDLRNMSDEDKSSEPPQIKFQPNFAEFPSHMTLRRENARYVEWRKRHPKAGDLNPGFPEPDVTRKQDIFKSEDYVKLDQYVLKTPSDYLDKPLADLVTYLTKNCKTDVEKARAIFRWCCAQDLSQLTGSEGNDTPRQMLMKCKVRRYYSKLYEQMCSLVGLECEIVTGAVKAARYQLGEDMKFDSYGNDWTVVRLDGTWRIVDLHFAALHQTGGDHGEWQLIDDNGKGYTEVEDSPSGITYKMDEFYFLTDPDEFIYNHFPHDERWQLLARPVSKDEFQKMAYIKEAFFEMGMDIRQAKRCVTHAPSGESVLQFGVPESKESSFMYRLWKSTKDGNITFDKEDKQFVQYVYMEAIGYTLTTRVMYPKTGRYKLEIFCDNSKSDVAYKCVTKHLLLCTGANKLGALPQNTRHIWGPGSDTANLGMIPDKWKYGTIETENGEAEIVFTCTQQLDIRAKMRADKRSEEELSQWVLIRAEDGKIIINLRVQEAGTYALDIWAKPKGIEGTLPQVCTYLVNASSPVPNKIKFPEIDNQHAGETKNNIKFQITPISHKHAYFLSLDGYEEITLKYPTPLTFSTEMKLQQQDDLVEDIDNHIFCSQTEGQICLKVRFPKSGIYNITIYAKEEDGEGTLPCVFEYVVSVPVPMVDCRPFPIQFNRWGMGCKVEGMGDGQMEESKDVKVKATVPNAVGVAMIKKEGWTHLKQDENGDWVGTVNTGEADQKIKLAAQSEGDSSYRHLMEYEIKGKAELTAKQMENEAAVKIEREKWQQEEIERKKRQEELDLLEKELKAAIQTPDLKRLRKVVARVEEMTCTNKLMKDYNTARNMIKSIERMEKLKKAIMKMDQSSMAEIRSYNKPPKPVHDIMSASLLLMRKNEEETKTWQICKTLLNTTVLRRNVKSFNLRATNPEIASRSMRILQTYKLEDIMETSAVAACFYAWTVGMSEELNIVTKGGVKKSAPAKLKRQKEIFAGSV